MVESHEKFPFEAPYQRLQEEHEALLLEFKGLQGKYNLDSIDWNIKYEAEKSLAESLGQAVLEFNKLKMQFGKQQEYIKKLKREKLALEAAVEGTGEGNPCDHLAKRLENELKTYKENTVKELTEKEKANQKLSSALEQYKTGFEDSQGEIKNLTKLLETEREENCLFYKTHNELQFNYNEACENITYLKRENSLVVAETKKDEEAKFSAKDKENKAVQADLEKQLQEKDEEIAFLRDKMKNFRNAKEEFSVKLQLQEQEILQHNEDRAKLESDLKCRNQTIYQLQNSIQDSVEDAQAEYEDFISQLNREKQNLQEKYNSLAQSFNEQLEKSHGSNDELAIQLRSAQQQNERGAHERAGLKEQLRGSEETIGDLKAKIRYCEENEVNIRKELKADFKPALLKLQGERDELRLQLKELERSADSMRKSLFPFDTALSNELEELGERLSSTFNGGSFAHFIKQIEDLKVEVSKKDFEITTLKSSEEALVKECNEVHAEVKTLRDTAKKQPVNAQIAVSSVGVAQERTEGTPESHKRQLQVTQELGSSVGMSTALTSEHQPEIAPIKGKPLKKLDISIPDSNFEVPQAATPSKQLFPKISTPQTMPADDNPLFAHTVTLPNSKGIFDFPFDSLTSPQFSMFSPHNIAVIESERDMLQAENSKLVTELTQVKQQWGNYNNQLREDLETEQKQLIRAMSQIQRLEVSSKQYKEELEGTAKKKSWWKRLKSSRTEKKADS